MSNYFKDKIIGTIIYLSGERSNLIHDEHNSWCNLTNMTKLMRALKISTLEVEAEISRLPHDVEGVGKYQIGEIEYLNRFE